MSTTRRGFLKLLSALVSTPVIAKLSLDSGLVLPPEVQAVEVIEPAIVQSGAASFARANRIFCMPGMVGQLADHVRSSAMAALPGGTHFQVRAVPMTAAEVRGVYERQGTRTRGMALLWVSESDMTPRDHEFELVGRFMVPKQVVPQSDWAVHPETRRATLDALRGDASGVVAELEKSTGVTPQVPRPVTRRFW